MKEAKRLDVLLQRHPKTTFPVLAGLIVAVIAGSITLYLLEKPADPVLPVEFRLIHPHLDDLPVTIDHIRSCSCWHGPRNQAQRKYKFRVINHSDRELNIGGGEKSALRLIVAYPKERRPVVTLPAPSGEEVVRRLASPNDVDIPITTRVEPVKPTRLPGTNDFFGVPEGYSVWALPPAPNKLAEMVEVKGYGEFNGTIYAHGSSSYPTVVDQTHLLPGEEYKGDRLGHGTWTFYIPITQRIAKRLEGDGYFEPILPRSFYERFVIFVGIAALAPSPDGRGELLGFGPAPSDNVLAEPGDL